MPGIQFVQEVGQQAPFTLPFLLGKSVTMYNGDLVVLTTLSTIAPVSGTPGLRDLGLVTTDQSGHYANGILGMIVSDVAANASAQAVNQVAPGGITTGGTVYSLPSIDALNGFDSVTGASWVQVILASGQNTFAGYLTSGSAVASPALIGSIAGLSISSQTPPITYLIDTTATGGTTPGTGNQCVVITGVDVEDPLYNAHGGRVYFRFIGAYEQLSSGLGPYAT